MGTSQPTIVYAATSTPVNGLRGYHRSDTDSGCSLCVLGNFFLAPDLNCVSSRTPIERSKGRKGVRMAYGDIDSAKEKGYNPSTTSRNSHNEKERRRRSRMKYSCQMLRTLIPGIADKTDKATVLEHAVHYVLHMQRCAKVACDVMRKRLRACHDLTIVLQSGLHSEDPAARGDQSAVHSNS